MNFPPTNRISANRALVGTYEQPSYDDPWNAVNEYERVKRYSVDSLD